MSDDLAVGVSLEESRRMLVIVACREEQATEAARDERSAEPSASVASSASPCARCGHALGDHSAEDQCEGSLTCRCGGWTIDPLVSRVAALGEALNRFGWHVDGCRAYWSASSDMAKPATEVGELALECTCGFRAALGLLDSSESVTRGGPTA